MLNKCHVDIGGFAFAKVPASHMDSEFFSLLRQELTEICTMYSLDCSECGFSILWLVSHRIKIVPSHITSSGNKTNWKTFQKNLLSWRFARKFNARKHHKLTRFSICRDPLPTKRIHILLMCIGNGLQNKLCTGHKVILKTLKDINHVNYVLWLHRRILEMRETKGSKFTNICKFTNTFFVIILQVWECTKTDLLHKTGEYRVH